VPVLAGAFWRDEVVRLEQYPAASFPRIAVVVSPRFERHNRVQSFGGEYVGTLLVHLFSLLRFDSAVIAPSTEGRPGLISVAHIAGFDPTKVVKLLEADKAE
jgi:hypothetical protein